VITTKEALAAGVTKAALEWARGKAVLRPIRQGVYTSGMLWAEASPVARHRLEILSQQRVHPELVACGLSAATALGLPMPDGPPLRPHLTAGRGPQHRGARGNAAGATRRRAWLPDEDVWTMRSGIRVTSPARTVLDCAREWELPWGLAIADAAVARWNIYPARLVSLVDSRLPIPGGRRARWAAERARPGIESPLESLARSVIILAGLPEPTPQVRLQTRAGPFRVDLLDEPNRVITEADGRIKYTSAEDLWREKRREDALRDAGFEVVRFTMPDYRAQSTWLAGYHRALARAMPGKSR
jgi:very-short-patch-repair endonuclease